MAIKHLLLVLSTACFVYCENSNTNGTKKISQETSSFRRSREIRSYLGLVTCAMKYDVSCFVDAAEDYLEYRRTELLAQADAEALRSTGRSDLENRPSYLANTLGRLISEFTNMFQNGFSGFFKFGREAADDDEDDDDQLDDNELTDTTTSVTNGEAREKQKKKKKKLHSLLKLLAVGFIIYKKVCLILKFFHAALQFKFYLLALGGLLLHAVKFWLSLKKESHPTKVIYYEHAQHQHHYGHGDEDGHSIWARAFTDADNVSAADLAYRTQRPHYFVQLS